MSAEQVRAAFQAGFLAVWNKPTEEKGAHWSFDGPSAADKEPEAWEAWSASLPPVEQGEQPEDEIARLKAARAEDAAVILSLRRELNVSYPSLRTQISALQAQLAEAQLQRDSAREQFDRHVEWASAQIALHEQQQKVDAQRIETLEQRVKLQTGQLRLCVTCGRTRDASVPREQPDADCVHPEHGAPCLYDMTPMEAWQHWRQIAHDRGEELRQAQQRLQQLQGEREKTNG